MKTKNALTLITFALAIIFSSCSVATNLDVRETAFPSEQKFSITYSGVQYVTGGTMTLANATTDVGTTQVLSMKNSNSSSTIVVQSIKFTDADHFAISSPTTFPVSIAASESSPLKIYLNTTKAGTYTTTMTVDYTVDGRSQSYVLSLTATRTLTTSTEISLSDESGNAIDTNYAFDLGYKSSGTITRTITLKNTGNTSLTIYSIVSGNGSISVSSAPTSGTELAAGGTTTFSLTMAAPATETSGTITIATNSTTQADYSFSVYGGNGALNITPSGAYSYLLTANKAYDFGYASGSTSKTITLTNSGTTPITLVPANFTTTTVANGGFTSGGVSTTTVKPGATTTLTVTYSPTSATSWDSSYCTIVDNYGRSYNLYLTGSGFAQPTDISTAPKLWLRADRISSGNIFNDSGTKRVDVWSDQSGNGFNATSVYYNESYLRPIYNPNGINSLPSLNFTGASTIKEEMKVMPSTGPIISGATGTTTFVVFRTSTITNGSAYILAPYYSPAVQSYPVLYWDTMSYDTTDGFYNVSGGTPLSQWRFAISGYFLAYEPSIGSTGNNVSSRYPTMATPPFTSATRPLAPVANTSYVIAMQYDSIPSATTSTTNIKMLINQKNLNMAYWYSATASSVATGTGAFGQPSTTDGAGTALPYSSNNDFLYAIENTNNGAPTPVYTLRGLRYNKLYNGTTFNYNRTISLIYIGSTNGSAASGFQGDIAEIIMYDQTLSPADIATINKYLSNKYGVASW